MKTTIAGIETQYQHIGKTGSVLFLLHGWGCTWEIWAPIVSELSEKYQLIIPDLPSFGKSEEPKTVWGTKQFVEWLKVLVQEVAGTTPISLLGHSFGGKIAALFASQHPHSLKHLILVDASGLPDALSTTKVFQEKTVKLMPHAIKNLVPESLKKKLATFTDSSLDYRNASLYQKEVLKKILKEDLSPDIINIKTPTLIIWGKQDQDTPIHQGQRFHQLIHSSTFKIFEHSQHFPFVNEPKKFVKTVDLFVS